MLSLSKHLYRCVAGFGTTFLRFCLARLHLPSVAVILGSMLFACGSDKPSETNAPAATNTVIADKSPMRLDACGERVQEFLRWYLDLTDPEKERPKGSYISFKWPITPEADSEFIAHLNSNPEYRSATQYIQMNWSSIDSYMTMLRKSGYFSQSYLQAKRASLIERGKELEAAKLDDGTLPGFDADEVFWTQDMYEHSDIEQLRPYKDANLKSGLAYKFPLAGQHYGFLLYLKNENGRCVLDSIGHWLDESQNQEQE